MTATDPRLQLSSEDFSSHCSHLSRSNGEDPIGSAPCISHLLVLELPRPWKADIVDSVHFPPALKPLMKDAARQGIITNLQCIAPDDEYSRPGRSRLMAFHRPEGRFTDFEGEEYFVPTEEILPLAEAILLRREDLPRYQEYRQDREGVRDLLVCTHVVRDACCGRFGAPLYRQLRQQATETLRVWQTNHLGGHRLAPTLAEFPTGRYWGHLSADKVETLIHRTGEVEPLRLNYRGWCGVKTDWEQAAEREAFIREGWDWLDYRKEVRLLEKSDNEASLKIAYASSAEGPAETYEATVKLVGTVTTQASCGKEKISTSRLLQVSRLEKGSS